MNNQKVMKAVSALQSKLSKGDIQVDVPCGAEPIIELLGGIHARAAINESNPGRFPNNAEEYKMIDNLVKSISK